MSRQLHGPSGQISGTPKLCADCIANEQPCLDLANIQHEDETLHVILRVCRFLKLRQIFLKVNDSLYQRCPKWSAGECTMIHQGKKENTRMSIFVKSNFKINFVYIL